MHAVWCADGSDGLWVAGREVVRCCGAAVLRCRCVGHTLPCPAARSARPPPPPGPPLQVKEVKLDPEGARSSEDDTQRVRAEAEARRSALEQWCITSYGEAFSSWIHVCAVRLFVESILRYGLPPQVRLKGGA